MFHSQMYYKPLKSRPDVEIALCGAEFTVNWDTENTHSWASCLINSATVHSETCFTNISVIKSQPLRFDITSCHDFGWIKIDVQPYYALFELLPTKNNGYDI